MIYVNNKKSKAYLNGKKVKLVSSPIVPPIEPTYEVVTDGLVIYNDARGYKGRIEDTIPSVVGDAILKVGNYANNTHQWRDSGIYLTSNNISCSTPLNNWLSLNEPFTFEISYFKKYDVGTYINSMNAFQGSNDDFTLNYKKTDGTNGSMKIFFNKVIKDGYEINSRHVIDYEGQVHFTFRYNGNGTINGWFNGYKIPQSLITNAVNFANVDPYAHNYSWSFHSATSNETTFQFVRFYNRALTDEECYVNAIASKETAIGKFDVYPKTYSLRRKENVSLVTNVVPIQYEPTTTYRYASSNPSVATVSSDGRVSGVTNGTATITATAVYNNTEISNTSLITVQDIPITPPVQTKVAQEIDICNRIDSLEIGEEYVLMSYLLPNTATDENLIKYSSSNPDVCSVRYGVLSANSVGTAVITVTDINNTLSATMNIEIKPKTVVDPLPSEIYNVVLATHGIKNDGTDSTATTNGIEAMFRYAEGKGYKKIIFPKGKYLVNPTVRTITPPTEMIVDWNGSRIDIDPNNEKTLTGYAMFNFNNCKNTTFINGEFHGERYTTSKDIGHPNNSEDDTMFEFNRAYRCGLENCWIGDSPGFNIQTFGIAINGYWTLILLKKAGFEAGGYDDLGNKDSRTTGCWRSKTKIDASILEDSYEVGNYIQSIGYITTARIYDIIFYDADGNFIEKHKNRIQYFRYNKPTNAKTFNIVFYQTPEITAFEPGSDYEDVFAEVYTAGEPYRCFIRNCTIANNWSTGIAICGGKWWTIENNKFINNGVEDPWSDIDFEDGWEHMVGNIIRYNEFGGSPTSGAGIIICAGHSYAIHDNVFKGSLNISYSRASSWRIYSNSIKGKNVTLKTAMDSIFADNVLYKCNIVNLSDAEKYYHGTSAKYKINTSNNTIIT